MFSANLNKFKNYVSDSVEVSWVILGRTLERINLEKVPNIADWPEEDPPGLSDFRNMYDKKCLIWNKD